jgi:DNA-directed RNA polymerase subunit RPC12/RpoP
MQRVNRQGYYCSRCGARITQEEYERDMSLCSNCEQEVDREEE